MKVLEGIAMELEDCAYPTLTGVEITDDPKKAFMDTNWALLVGARPRSKGIERKDLLQINAPIFVSQGKAINKYAASDVRIVVVGNPANTNTLITATNAPDIPKERFSTMTRLDQNRAIAQLAKKLKALPSEIKRVIIWGNHSNTMVPDITHTTLNGKPIAKLIDKIWYHNDFLPNVINRGAKVIEYRGTSSALSAANALIDHLKELYQGSPKETWSSMAVWSNGYYDTPKAVFFSFPCFCKNGNWEIVKNLKIDNRIKYMIKKTGQDLLEEKIVVSQFL